MSRRSAASSEQGFALVELVAAAALLMLGVLGVLASFDRSRDVISRAEVRETAIFRAERELERLRALPYEQLGLTALPSHAPGAASPDRYVKPGGRFQWDPATSAATSLMVTGGVVAPKAAWDDGRLRGTLHTYITTYDDPAVAGVAGPTARRVIVAAEVDGPWSPPRPIMVSMVVHDPGPTP